MDCCLSLHNCPDPDGARMYNSGILENIGKIGMLIWDNWVKKSGVHMSEKSFQKSSSEFYATLHVFSKRNRKMEKEKNEQRGKFSIFFPVCTSRKAVQDEVEWQFARVVVQRARRT